MKKRHSLQLVVFLLAAVILGASIHPSFLFSQVGGKQTDEIEILNKNIAEKKARIKQLEESMAIYKKKIDEKRLEAVSLSNQVAILDNRIAQVELDIEATKAKLETLTLEIETLEAGISEKQKVIDKQKEIIAEFLRTLQQEDDKTYIEILAAYENFSEFYNKIQFLEKIDSDLGRSVRTIRLAKEEMEEKNRQTKERKDAYDALSKELEDKKKDLDEQVFHKQDLLAQTHASELTFKTLLGNLKQQYQDTENEINGIEREVRRRLEQQKKIEEVPEGGELLLGWPTNGRHITARFHDPDYPFRNVFEHSAIDIRAAQGTAVKAAASGYIARAKRCTLASCYSYVMIVHSGNISTVYGHLSQIVVSEDQFVTKGDVIGYSGGTPGTAGAGPFVTGPHLHFETRKNGIPVNPLQYLVRDY